MRILLITTIFAGLAQAANATPIMMHRHHAMKSDTSSVAVRDLNEKSLQQASAGSSTGMPMSTPMSTPPMSDSGNQAPSAPPTNDMTAPSAIPAPQ